MPKGYPTLSEIAPTLRRIVALESDKQRAGPITPVFSITPRDSGATRVGDLVVRLDRELRRVPPILTALANPRATHERLPLPESVDQTGLRLVKGEPGSFWLSAEPFGILLTILSSRPITTIATLDALWDIRRRAWRWIFHHRRQDRERVYPVEDFLDWHRIAEMGIEQDRRFRIEATHPDGARIFVDFGE